MPRTGASAGCYKGPPHELRVSKLAGARWGGKDWCCGCSTAAPSLASDGLVYTNLPWPGARPLAAQTVGMISGTGPTGFRQVHSFYACSRRQRRAITSRRWKIDRIPCSRESPRPRLIGTRLWLHTALAGFMRQDPDVVGGRDRDGETGPRRRSRPP